MSAILLDQITMNHDRQWQWIYNALLNNRLPQGLLLTGPLDLGKALFSKQLAHFLLCKKPSKTKPCGLCDACHQFAAGNHPDYFELGATEQSKSISIDDIRDLTISLQKSSHQQGFQIVVINPISALTHSASHALLKTLEEPLGKVVFLAVLSEPDQILLTLKSRLVPLPFDRFDDVIHLNDVNDEGVTSLALDVLNYVGKTMVLKQSALLLPTTWTKENAIDVIQIMYSICKDAIYLQTGLSIQNCMFSKYPEKIQYLARLLPMSSWYICLDQISQVLADAASATAFNQQYMLEMMMMSLQMQTLQQNDMIKQGEN